MDTVHEHTLEKTPAPAPMPTEDAHADPVHENGAAEGTGGAAGAITIKPPEKYLAALAYRLDWLHKLRAEPTVSKQRCWFINYEIHSLFWILQEYAAATETDVRSVLERIGRKAVRKRAERSGAAPGPSAPEGTAAASGDEAACLIDLAAFDAFAAALEQSHYEQWARHAHQAWEEMDPPIVRPQGKPAMAAASQAA